MTSTVGPVKLFWPTGLQIYHKHTVVIVLHTVTVVGGCLSVLWSIIHLLQTEDTTILLLLLPYESSFLLLA